MSKEYDHFWARLIEQRAERIQEFEAVIERCIFWVRLIEQQAERIQKLEAVIERCIKSMASIDCLELEWLEKALKDGE